MIYCFKCKQEKEESDFLDKKGNIVEKCLNLTLSCYPEASP